MKLLKKLTRLGVTAGVLGALTGVLVAQGLNPATILHPPADSWPTYHGNYNGERHSSLTQITPANVHNLGLAWAFQTNQMNTIKASPLVVHGVMYFSVPDNVWAIDALTGRMIWHYKYPPNKGFHIGSRGVGMWHDRLYFETPDDHLVCLNAKDGTVIWQRVMADVKLGYWATTAPLIIRNHVITGISGDFDNLQGFMKSWDPETGKLQWTWYGTPPVGTPGKSSGATTWMTGTYDPQLNLLYWGTGNPTPVLNGKPRPGDDLYTCSIVALNPDTGKLVWAYQVSPHDTHDWDAAEVPMLVNGTWKGKPRKLLLQASRNGYFFVIDRKTGKGLLSRPFVPVDWALGINKNFQPIPNPEKEPAPDGRLIAPDESGGNNFRSPSFDPKTGLYLVTAHPSWSIYFAKPADGTFGWAGADYGVWSKGVLEAIDYHTGKPKWTKQLGPYGSYAGVLTTDSGLAFTADAEGNFMALRTATGQTLWHTYGGARLATSPITYELYGRQYVATGIGGVMYAWALPRQDIHSKK